ncbi:11395_t:CDS:2 [Funneliformis geosporum]|uniref:Endoplasmic reticulum transmembrane protein n=1 Tax=Funneliformis geosporum TaxID=1117311 RepID=A0A9W4WIR9_9GLOM|nr:11395_t:CDS:2 [Funneliformis geosporum]CAI2164763.1 7755_t:CDS:2 [Funneliformis geosporum]
MTLYYTLVFLLLVAESAAFVVLILPFPHAWRRGVLRWVSRSTLVARSQVALKFAFVFVLILFLDATNRTYTVQHDKNEPLDARTEAAHHAKKFYNQRNMYLTGFTLFLSLILNRTYVLVVELLASEDNLEALKRQATNHTKEYLRATDSETQMKNEIEKLSKELDEEKKKSLDFETLKKQASQQADEYDRLADRFNELEKQSQIRNDDDKKSV